MNAKKVIRSFINPDIWVLIVGVIGFVLGLVLIGTGDESMSGIAFVIMMLTVIPFLFGLFRILPAIFKTNGTLKHLENSGNLGLAQKELCGVNVKFLCKNRVACTDHFLLVKKGSCGCAYSDILWVYKHRVTQRLLMIPIWTTESVIIHTGKGKYSIDLGRKGNPNELTELITVIYSHNPNVLIGYSPENKNAYRQINRER